MRSVWKTLNAPIPKRFVYFSAGVIALLIVGYKLGTSSRDKRWSNVIAMQRFMFEHQKNRRFTNPVPAMAVVILEKATNGFRGGVGVEMTYSDDRTGFRWWELGVAATRVEALEKWGLVEWKPDEIYAGKVSKQLIVKRDELEGGGR